MSNANIKLLPLVEFEYPDSETNVMKLRYVRVVEVDNAYVKGWELPTPYSPIDLAKYKQYSFSRIPRHGVTLKEFKNLAPAT